MTEEKVVQLVREKLQQHRPQGVALDLVDGQVLKGDGCWYVGVRPSAPPSRMYDLYTALAEVEESLAETEQVEILFRLSEPLEAAAPEARTATRTDAEAPAT